MSLAVFHTTPCVASRSRGSSVGVRAGVGRLNGPGHGRPFPSTTRRSPNVVTHAASRGDAKQLAPDGKLAKNTTTKELKGFVPEIPKDVPMGQSFAVGAGGAVVIFLYMQWGMRNVKKREAKERAEEEKDRKAKETDVLAKKEEDVQVDEEAL
jgi:hypothetical protein